MRSLLRQPSVVLLALLVALLAGTALVLAAARARLAISRLPERGGRVERVAGCPAPVDIVLDGRGIPHVSAPDESALWFAQGYLHASDRFFQMEMARRAATGRLAEVFGESVLSSDRAARTWRLGATARRQVVQLERAASAALEAYSAGVNAALARHGRWIAPEIWALAVDPEPWRPEDSLAIGQLFQIHMSWAMGEELERAVQLRRLGRMQAIDLWGWSPAEARRWIPPGPQVTSPARPGEPITPPMHFTGSNAWAVAPARTAGGRALVANDPHVGVLMPSPWFAIHLRGPDLHVAGLSVPGSPGVLVGHNEQVAWGITMAMIDDQDLFVLTLDDDRSSELVDGNWQPLRTITESIGVRWATAPQLLKLRVSERGPVVRETSREVMALGWTGSSGPSPLRAVLGMNRAETVVELVEAWRGVVGPSFNLVAADTGGRIANVFVGAAPLRSEGAGRLPAPGADSRWAWRGFVSLAGRFAVFDPDAGFVAAANHDPVAEGDFPGVAAVPGEFQPPWRVRRIRRQLAARDDWDLAACLDLQRDVMSLLASAVLAQLWPDLERHGGRSATELEAWDGRMDSAGRAPLLFSRLMLELGKEIGGDEAVRDGLAASPVGAGEVLLLLAGGLSESWWDDVRTGREEHRGDIVDRVLDRLDGMPPADSWGRVHQVRFDHPLRPLPLIGRLVGRTWSRGPFAASGDGTTVNAHYWQVDRPFEVMAIPSARFVAEVGNWDATVLIVPPGQSGRPWSSHYADQLTGWLAQGAARLPFSPGAVEAAAAARLELLPPE